MRYDLLFCNETSRDARQNACDALQKFKERWPGAPEDGANRVYGLVTTRPTGEDVVLVCVMYVPRVDTTKEWVERGSKSVATLASRRDTFLTTLQTKLEEASGVSRVRIENHHGDVLKRERQIVRKAA